MLDLALVGAILVGDDDEVVGTEGVDFDLAELAGGNLVLEEDIEIGVGETLGMPVSVVSGVNRSGENIPWAQEDGSKSRQDPAS